MDATDIRALLEISRGVDALNAKIDSLIAKNDRLITGPSGIREMKQTIANKEAEIERLREALHKLIQACDAGKLREVGIGGMTLDAQLRRSVLNGVSAWAVEEARAALGEEK